jgi:hypothetical protein
MFNRSNDSIEEETNNDLEAEADGESKTPASESDRNNNSIEEVYEDASGEDELNNNDQNPNTSNGSSDAAGDAKKNFECLIVAASWN